MDQVTIHEAKTHLSRLIASVQAGGEVIICKADTPIARLVAYQEPCADRQLGQWRGQVWVADDFDAPLPESFFLGTSE
jgi:prevent-host-death family protein